LKRERREAEARMGAQAVEAQANLAALAAERAAQEPLEPEKDLVDDEQFDDDRDDEPVNVRIEAPLLAKMLSDVLGWYPECAHHAQYLAAMSKQLAVIAKTEGLTGHVEFDAIDGEIVEGYEHGYEQYDEQGHPVRMAGASANFFSGK
jgi:hypothetical protein